MEVYPGKVELERFLHVSILLLLGEKLRKVLLIHNQGYPGVPKTTALVV
jgi:hypothetical protein